MLIVSVKVKSGQGRPEKDGETLVIHTREKFEKGKANRDVVRQIAEFYGVKSSDVRIRSGLTSRNKIVEVSSK